MPEAMSFCRLISIRRRQQNFRSSTEINAAVFSIDGMGEKAAEGMEEAAKDGPYLSRDDFRQRTKASKTVVDYMGTLGLLGDLPESNQLSLFDRREDEEIRKEMKQFYE